MSIGASASSGVFLLPNVKFKWLPTRVIDVELDDLAHRPVQVENPRGDINCLEVDGVHDEFSFVEGDAERLLDARKIREVKPVPPLLQNCIFNPPTPQLFGSPP